MSKTLGRNRDNRLGVYGLLDLHSSFLEQAVLLDSSPTFANLTLSNDLTVGGDLTVNGLTTVINTDVLTIKDNLIEINASEIGPGITFPSGLAGVQINRGSSIAYQFVFRESDNAFKIGEVGDLQTVATRENSPMDKGVMLFNNAEKRLDSVSNIPLSITFSSDEVSNTSANGAVRIIGGLGITKDVSMDGRLYIKGTNYNNYIHTDLNQNTIINSSSSINLNVSTNVKIPANKPLIFDTISHSILSNGIDLEIITSGSLNLSNISTRLNTHSSLIFGTNSQRILYDGTDLQLHAANVFTVNPITNFINVANSTSSTNGSVKIAGGLSISNTLDATSFTNGGTITTAGGIAVAKKIFVGGLGTFQNTDEIVSISTLGGTTISKKLSVGSNYSGNPSLTPGIFIQSNGYTYNDNNTISNGVVSNVNFNFLGINSLSAVNTNISTTNSSTLFIEGAPISGTNQTITNKYALNVAGGTSKFDGNVQVNNTLENTSLVLEGGATIKKNLNVNNKFNVGSNIVSAPSSSGVFIALQSSTVTDNVTASGTVDEMLFNVIARPTLSSINVITTTDTSTLVLDGEPIRAGNQTITNSYSLWIKRGMFRTDGEIKILNTTDATTSMSGSLTTLGGVGIAKRLYVAGISTFENVLEATNTSTSGTLVKGGLSVSKSLLIGKRTATGFDSFQDTPGLGKIFTSGGSIFTDNTTDPSSTALLFSSNNFKITTIASLNTNVSTTEAHTVYIEGSPVAGSNQTITNSYALTIASGKSKFNGSVDITGEINSSNNLTLQGTLDVNGPALLDQVTILTDDGQFSVSGTNAINMNVQNTCTLTNTIGNINVNSQNGSLFLNGSSSLTLDTTGNFSIDGNTSSNINISTGTLSIGAPTVLLSGDTVNVNAMTVLNLATLNSQIPVNIGHSSSQTTVNGNLSVIGNLSIQGDTITLNSKVITTEDNAVVVNSMPDGISDGGLLVRRYQFPNNNSEGKVIEDTPYENGQFQGNLQLGTGASILTNYYKGWWIKITSGVANNYVRRIKSSDASRNIVIYSNSDNSSTFTDGLDLTITISSGDTYNLYSGTYVGMFFNETSDEWSIGNVPFDQGAGTFPLKGYRDLHINSLKIDAGLTLFGENIIEGTAVIDNDDIKTLLVRKNGNSGDVFYIDSINSTLNMSNPINTVNSTSEIKLFAKDSINIDTLYSQITSKIKVNTSTNVTGELSIGVVKNSVLQNYIILDGVNQKTIINSLIDITNSNSSDSTSASLKTNGGITSLVTTDATSVTSGGGLTLLGGAAISKKLFVGTDLNVNSSGSGSATIKIGPSSSNTESSVSFYGDLNYSGHLWKVGHALPGNFINAFGIYNATTNSLCISINPSTNGVNILNNFSVTGGATIGSNLGVAGSITGTWAGDTLTVENGGTGVTSLLSNALLIGNTTGSVVTESDLTYTNRTLNLPKINSNDTTDSTSSSTGAVILAGGLGVAKRLYVGTELNIAGNITLSSTDTSIGHSTLNDNDNGSINIFSGGASGNSRGANILLKGNEHSSDSGKIVLECGNVNSTGSLSIYTATFERFKVSYDGVINSYSTTDATSSTNGSVIISGGLAIAKKLYVGTDLSVGGNFNLTTITSGTWNGSTITVPHGGTGATNFTENNLLLGGGTSSIKTDANLSFSTNTLNVPRVVSTDTTQSISSSTGAVTLAGGLGVTKNVYLGDSLFINNFLGVGITTNVNSALTLANGSNIGVNTIVSFDTGSLSISGSGVGLASRGSIINLYGINHSTLAGNINIQSGTTAGSLKLTTGGVSRVDITNSGFTTFSKLGDTTSSTTGAIVISGGVGISNSSNAVNSTNGGALTVAGGVAIGQDLYIGGNLIMTGTIPGAMTIISPTIITSDLTSITTIISQNIKLRKVGLERTLTCAFEVTPSSLRSTCSFEFLLPEVVTNINFNYDVVFSINGYLTDFTPVENITAHGVIGSRRGKIRFTSGPTTSIHTIQITANYTIV